MKKKINILLGTLVGLISNSWYSIFDSIDYHSMDATEYEMSSKKNEARLDKAIENFNKGFGMRKNLIEN